MTEFTADVWRRKVSSIPLIGRTVTKDQVSAEASDVQSALDQIFRAERLEYPPSRFRVCVQIRIGSETHCMGATELRTHAHSTSTSTPER